MNTLEIRQHILECKSLILVEMRDENLCPLLQPVYACLNELEDYLSSMAIDQRVAAILDAREKLIEQVGRIKHKTKDLQKVADKLYTVVKALKILTDIGDKVA